jgi:hypothetical protein
MEIMITNVESKVIPEKGRMKRHTYDQYLYSHARLSNNKEYINKIINVCTFAKYRDIMKKKIQII